VKIGKIVKTAPVTFAVVPGSISRSTRWRCLHWEGFLLVRPKDVN